MSRIALLVILLIPLGCAAPFVTAQPEIQHWDEPTQGREMIVSVGDALLAVGKAQQQRAIIVPATLSTGAYRLAAGEYVVTAVRDDGVFRAPLRPTDTQASTMNSILTASLTGDRPSVPSILEWKAKADRPPELCIGGSSCIKNPAATLEWIDIESFERRLIYTGRSGKVIRIEYREFSNNLARPAYSTDLTFDLARSAVIGVKGAQIKVLGLSNEAIKFQVLRSFTDEQTVGRSNRRRAVSVPAAPAP